MQMNLKSLMLILVSGLLATASYAGYDNQCLSDCFSTGHECNYCNYQCYSEDTYRAKPHYSDEIPCPLQGYSTSRE